MRQSEGVDSHILTRQTSRAPGESVPGNGFPVYSSIRVMTFRLGNFE